MLAFGTHQNDKKKEEKEDEDEEREEKKRKIGVAIRPMRMKEEVKA